ncbi:MAG: hypothetical protein HYX63_15415 [Gammaproteobacteria bacterium]|nr:hypothetical protein [Gammaproteobacteria bacterium]
MSTDEPHGDLAQLFCARQHCPSMFVRRLAAVLWVTLAGAGTVAADSTKPTCELSGNNSHFEVTSTPDDGEWGATVEIRVSDAVQIRNRLLVVEERPIEGCWWLDFGKTGSSGLVIGLGAAPGNSAGVRVYKMKADSLVAMPIVPPAAPGSERYRYLVINGVLHAVTTNIAVVGESTDLRYDFDRNAWVNPLPGKSP